MALVLGLILLLWNVQVTNRRRICSKEALSTIEAWFDARFEEGGTTKNINTMAPMLTLAYLYEKSGNITYLPWLESWAEWAMHGLPRTKYGGMSHMTYNSMNSQELWDDTLFMACLFLARAGVVCKRQDWIDEAVYQFVIHARYLSDPVTGLWYHGWTFNGRHNFANAFWARGNSWITVAIGSRVGSRTQLNASSSSFVVPPSTSCRSATRLRCRMASS